MSIKNKLQIFMTFEVLQPKPIYLYSDHCKYSLSVVKYHRHLLALPPSEVPAPGRLFCWKRRLIDVDIDIGVVIDIDIGIDTVIGIVIDIGIGIVIGIVTDIGIDIVIGCR